MSPSAAPLHATDATDRDALRSGIHAIVPPNAEEPDELTQIEDAFIEAWALMAGAFAMDRSLGRIHALVFVSGAHLDASDISRRLGLPEEVCALHLHTLVGWGVIHPVSPDDSPAYGAEQDPWVWFLKTLRARRDREFGPIRGAVERVRDQARALATRDRDRGSRAAIAFERIDRFASFVTDFSKLADALITLGAGPMLRVAKMTARFVLAA